MSKYRLPDPSYSDQYLHVHLPVTKGEAMNEWRVIPDPNNPTQYCYVEQRPFAVRLAPLVGLEGLIADPADFDYTPDDVRPDFTVEKP